MQLAPISPKNARRAPRALALAGAALLLAACEDGTGPVPTRSNPLAGASLYVEPSTAASRQAEAWRETRPADAAAMERIAREPQAVWLVDGDPVPELTSALAGAAQAGALPVFVLYYIPQRDCGQAGAASGTEYRAWVRRVAAELDGHEAVVVIEPDALGHLDCAGVDDDLRLGLLRDAVETMEAAGAVTYLDAGHARWLSVGTASARLEAAGVAGADGFALNVANTIATEESVLYGQTILERLGAKGFVVDTSRNGVGPTDDLEWCNPPGRKLGPVPTTSTPYPGVDALLWIKRPGESDGTCNGGPPAGEWWPEYALMLAS